MRNHKFGFEHLCLVLGLTLVLLCIGGCASTPTGPSPTPFERCMAQLGYKFHYTSDMVKAADWCYTHNNGDQP